MTSDETAGCCPNCDSTDITSRMVTNHFVYGVPGTGFPPVELTAEVLMFECLDCWQTWTGEQAELAREEAVQAYLKRTRA